MFDVNSKIAQNKAKYLKFHRQNIESTRNGTLRQLSRRFQTLIWRPGETVQNLESPGLSGRVDSFRAEKRSAQASAHPLSQAQGGLFCVLTLVCLFVTERVLTKTE